MRLQVGIERHTLGFGRRVWRNIRELLGWWCKDRCRLGRVLLIGSSLSDCGFLLGLNCLDRRARLAWSMEMGDEHGCRLVAT